MLCWLCSWGLYYLLNFIEVWITRNICITRLILQLCTNMIIIPIFLGISRNIKHQNYKWTLIYKFRRENGSPRRKELRIPSMSPKEVSTWTMSWKLLKESPLPTPTVSKNSGVYRGLKKMLRQIKLMRNWANIAISTASRCNKKQGNLLE